MPAPTVDDITKLVKDAMYVGIGLGVIGFQKAQVQRNELQKRLRGQVGEARTQFEDRVKLLEERLQGVEGRFETLLDQVEERLPEQAKEVSRQARTAARDARAQVRSIVSRAS